MNCNGQGKFFPKTIKAPNFKTKFKKKKKDLNSNSEIACFSIPTHNDTVYELVSIMCLKMGAFIILVLNIVHINILDILGLVYHLMISYQLLGNYGQILQRILPIIQRSWV